MLMNLSPWQDTSGGDRRIVHLLLKCLSPVRRIDLTDWVVPRSTGEVLASRD